MTKSLVDEATVKLALKVLKGVWVGGFSFPSVEEQRQAIIALRAAQPAQPAQPLTDEEINKAWRSVDYTMPYEEFRIAIARAIEAKLRSKNEDRN